MGVYFYLKMTKISKKVLIGEKWTKNLKSKKISVNYEFSIANLIKIDLIYENLHIYS